MRDFVGIPQPLDEFVMCIFLEISLITCFNVYILHIKYT